MNSKLLATVSAMVLATAAPAMAGRIVLTGHDNDFHQSSDATAATSAELAYIRQGSTLPVLVIDNGTEATGLINGVLGAGHQTTVGVGAVTAADFDHSVYSAFVVASVSSCGGCDNPVGTGTTLSAFSTAIASFFNAGGGILGLTSASDSAGFAYVPSAAGTTSPIFAFRGFSATTNGLADIAGFSAVNGDQTHNIFSEPGTGGVSSAYRVAERFTDGSAITVYTGDATIDCSITGTCVINPVPEPLVMGVFGVGLAGIGFVRRRFG